MLYLVICSCFVFQEDTATKQAQKAATELAQRFYAAFESGNAGGTLALSTVPFYFDGKAVIQQQDVLQVELRKLVESRDLTHGKRVPDVKLVAPYYLMKDRMPEKERSLLNQVVRDDDYLVLVMLKPTDVSFKKTENVVLLVRMKDGQPTVIGLKHTL